jgi:hypothetical protein
MPNRDQAFTEPIGLKVTKEQFQTLKALAARDAKPLAAWCRDTLLALASGSQPSPFQFGIMAEITATQAILIDLLCLLGRDGRITTPKAQEIVDRAQNAKYQEAIELLRYAYSRVARSQLDRAASGAHPRKENEHD